MKNFITFEGGEGSGKSSAIIEIKNRLEKLGYKVVVTREPGGIKISEDIRNIILDVNNKDITYETEALLYAASRTQHLHQKVLPALNEGAIVLCDRYLDSSLAYQGCGRDLGFEDVLDINKYALKYMPEKTFFIDVKPEVALKRIENRDKQDRLDLEEISFHEKVYNGFVKVVETYPNRVEAIDGTLPLEDIIELLYTKILNIVRG
ncbi:MAG: dTMP kinase [bacterium]